MCCNKAKVSGFMLLEVVASELIHSRKGSDGSKIGKNYVYTYFSERMFAPTPHTPTHQSEFFSKKKKIQHLGELLYFHRQLLCLGKLLFS